MCCMGVEVLLCLGACGAGSCYAKRKSRNMHLFKKGPSTKGDDEVPSKSQVQAAQQNNPTRAQQLSEKRHEAIADGIKRRLLRKESKQERADKPQLTESDKQWAAWAKQEQKKQAAAEQAGTAAAQGDKGKWWQRVVPNRH